MGFLQVRAPPGADDEARAFISVAAAVRTGSARREATLLAPQMSILLAIYHSRRYDIAPRGFRDALFRDADDIRPMLISLHGAGYSTSQRARPHTGTNAPSTRHALIAPELPLAIY